MAHGLQRRVLLNLQVFWDFPKIFPLLTSSLILAWSESRLCDFCPFNFLKVSFVTQDVVYLSGCSLWTWAQCVLCRGWLDKIVRRYQSYPVAWWCCWGSRVLLDSLPVDLSLSDRRCWRLRGNSGLIHFSCSSIQFCLTYFYALLLCACILKTVMSSWKMDSFIIM